MKDEGPMDLGIGCLVAVLTILVAAVAVITAIVAFF